MTHAAVSVEVPAGFWSRGAADSTYSTGRRGLGEGEEGVRLLGPTGLGVTQ